MPKRKRSLRSQPPAQWRSGYERRLREKLDAAGANYTYEGTTYALVLDVPGHMCSECRSRKIIRPTRYTPDFEFLDTGWIVEAKGKFDAKARKIALAFRAQYPNKRYALLFQRDNWMNKHKTSRYSDWCKKHDIPYAVGNSVPGGFWDVYG